MPMQTDDAALSYVKAALDANPDDELRWVRYADALLQQGRSGAARQALTQARQRGLQGQAIAALAQRIDARPEPHEMQALVDLLDQGRIMEGEIAATAMTKRYPEYGIGWKFRGVVLKRQGRHGEALRAMHRAAELLPDDEQAQSNFGAALAEANELAAAEFFHRRALQINPRYAQAYSNLGGVLSRQGRLAEAETCHRHALEIFPDYAEGHHNLGSTLNDLSRLEEARDCYRRALEIKADLADSHWNDGMLKLLSGDFEEGWREYEWRLQTETFLRTPRFLQARWSGRESLQGMTILLHAEQGLGDTIQFCRYAKLVHAAGANVILMVPPALKSLLSELAEVASVLAVGEPLPQFDFHCPLLSLPLAFDTSLANIPADVPYLSADAKKVEVWRDKLYATTRIPRIGVAWAGNPLHRHDYRRSIPLASFLAIDAPALSLYCLQKEYAPQDQAILRDHEQIHCFSNELNDFADTAALIDLMDLVITVDTAVAHLAGAMGKPVWILLPFQPDWRWLTGRQDSPWYPTARLFRQPAIGDWDSVMQDVRNAIKANWP